MIQMEPRERPGVPKERKSTAIGANRSPRATQYDPQGGPRGAPREPKEPKRDQGGGSRGAKNEK